MTAEDWARLGLLGNEIGLQWYAVTHPGTQLPNQNVIQTPLPGGGSVRVDTTGLLVVGVIIVIAAVVVLK